MKLISMSIYGTGQMYLEGAVANARLMPKIYPGWRLLVHIADDIPPGIITKLILLGADVKKMGLAKGHSGMLWRFLPAWDPTIGFTLFRDSDSRFNPREAAAVKAWIRSGKDAHCMHDHSHHASLPLFGGMWGIRGKVLEGPCPFQRAFHRRIPRGEDMRLLRRFVLPKIKDSLLRHSSVKTPKDWGPTKPFPKHTTWNGFVGQQYDDEGKPIFV